MTAIAIVGSRDFPNLELVKRFVEDLDDGTVIVTGGARGVDQAAEEAALPLGFTVQVIRADWSRYGRGAGMIRNTQIVKVSDEVVAFWDGESHGTEDTINKFRKAGKAVAIYGPDGESLKCPGTEQGEMFEP
jgi:predicted Rossmann-fold nucleotide-binding protein